jgi:hypothetical protein
MRLYGLRDVDLIRSSHPFNQLFCILVLLVFYFHNYALYDFISKNKSHLDAIIIGAEGQHADTIRFGA